MDDLAVGRLIRLARVSRRLRQRDVALEARVSQQTVSRIELGRLEQVPLGTMRRVAGVVGIRMVVEPAGAGASLDRLRGARHSAMHEHVARLFDELSDWVVVPEVTFAIYGERGAIDILAWHERSRSLLVIELKTELVDVQATVGTLDRKVRLATRIVADRGWRPLTVSSWLLIAEDSTNRRHVQAHEAMLRSAYPADGHAMAGWLRRPVGRIAGLSFLASVHGEDARRRLAPVRRVRVRAATPSGSQTSTG